MQHRETKLVSGIGSLTYEERLKVCDLTTLEERRVRGDMILCFKILNDYVDFGKNFFYFAKDRHSIDTRSATEGLLVPLKTTLEIRKNFFPSRVVNAWNTLPVEVRTASSVNSFKNLYDLYFSAPEHILVSQI